MLIIHYGFSATLHVAKFIYYGKSRLHVMPEVSEMGKSVVLNPADEGQKPQTAIHVFATFFILGTAHKHLMVHLCHLPL